MAFISFTSPPTGSVGIVPAPFYLDTTDDLDTITTAGYLNNQLGSSSALTLNSLYNGAMIFATNTDFTVTTLIASISSLNGIVTLTEQISGGNVTLPVVSGDFAVFDGTTGAIQDLGYLPSNAAKTTVVMANATVSSGNVPSFSDTAGTIGDSGVLASTLMQINTTNTMTSGSGIVLYKSNGTESSNAVTTTGTSGVITTSSLTTAGGSSYIISWTNSKITTASTVGLFVMGGTNTTADFSLKVVPGSSTSAITITNNTAATALNGTILLGYVVF